MKSRIAMIATNVLTAYTYEKQSRHEHPIPLFDDHGTGQVPLIRPYIIHAI
jgi:predicted nucleic acid-binding protein